VILVGWCGTGAQRVVCLESDRYRERSGATGRLDGELEHSRLVHAHHRWQSTCGDREGAFDDADPISAARVTTTTAVARPRNSGIPSTRPAAPAIRPSVIVRRPRAVNILFAIGARWVDRARAPDRAPRRERPSQGCHRDLPSLAAPGGGRMTDGTMTFDVVRRGRSPGPRAAAPSSAAAPRGWQGQGRPR